MIKKLAKQIASQYVSNPENFDTAGAMAKVARDHGLNAHQIDYFTGEVNTSIITEIQGGIPAGKYDPHFTFDTVKTASVMQAIQPARIKPAHPSLPEQPISKAFVHKVEEEPGPSKVEILADIKHRIQEKRRECIALENQVADASRKYRTKVAHELVTGTPVEVINSLPSQDIICPVVESMKKVAHLQEEFEMDQNHPIYKMGERIEHLKEAGARARKELDYLEWELKLARKK